MSHCAGRGLIGDFPYLGLSRDEFEQARKSLDETSTLLATEEKFEMALANYAELESTLFDISLRGATHGLLDNETARKDRTLLNRRIMNFAAIARMYLDHATRSELSKYADVASLKSREYDRLLGYRMMEALRNCSLHRELPLGTIVYARDSVSDGATAAPQIRLVVELRLNLKVLSDSQFNPKVAGEAKALPPEKLDLVRFIREYVDGISVIHDEIRSRTDSMFRQSIALLDDLVTRYYALIPHEERSGIECYAVDDNEQPQQTFWIEPKSMLLLEKLRKRRAPMHLSNFFVSNQLK